MGLGKNNDIKSGQLIEEINVIIVNLFMEDVIIQ